MKQQSLFKTQVNAKKIGNEFVLPIVVPSQKISNPGAERELSDLNFTIRMLLSDLMIGCIRFPQ